MENGPIEEIFPIENEDIPASHASLPEGILASSTRDFFVKV